MSDESFMQVGINVDKRRMEALGYTRDEEIPDWYPSYFWRSSPELVEEIAKKPFGDCKRPYILTGRRVVNKVKRWFKKNKEYNEGLRIKMLNSWFDKNKDDLNLYRLMRWAELYQLLLEPYVKKIDNNLAVTYADLYIITREVDNYDIIQNG